MILKDKEVIEYKLDSENNILGHKLWPKRKYPEFMNNPDPLDEMVEDGYLDEYDRPKWKLIDNAFVENVLPLPNPEQEANKYFQDLERKQMIKKLVLGIENKSNPDYQELKDMINILIP